MKRRPYKNYDQYLQHQIKKTADPRVRKRVSARQERYKLWFLEKLKILDPPVKNARILCIGARYGYEVKVLRHFGYDAIGLDLVPCPPLVVKGDMHQIPFADALFDAVYSNSLDHAYDLSKALSEVRRVLKPRAMVLFHLALGHEGKFESLNIERVEEVLSLLPDFRVLVSKGFKPYGIGLNHTLLLERS